MNTNPQSKFRIQELCSYRCNYTTDINNSRNYRNRILKETFQNPMHVTQQTKIRSKSKMKNLKVLFWAYDLIIQRITRMLIQNVNHKKYLNVYMT